MPGVLRTRAPARNRTEESRRRGADGRRRVAHDELGPKMMDFAPADLSSPDPRLMLKKRLREEMEALRGILMKAELLAGKTTGNVTAAPRRGKDGRFLAAEARPAAIKRRKTMPLVEVKPRMSADKISNLATRVSLLSEDMPSHILEFLKKECTGHEDKSRGEMELDIGSMRSSAMFELRKLLDEFAEEEKRRRQIEESTNASRAISRSPRPHQHEDGEIIEEEDDDAITDTRGDGLVGGEVLRSPAPIEDGEIPEEDIICSDATPGSTEKLAETGNSPNSSSSSSSSFGSSSNSGCSSGSSCSSSSDSDSSDSDSDDESVTSKPAPAVLPKTDASPVVPHKVLCSSPCISSLLEGGASPAAPEKFAAGTANIPRNRYSSGSAVLPKPLEQRPGAQDHKFPLSQAQYSDMIAKGRQKQRRLQNPKRQRAYEELEEMERNAKPISDWIHPMHLRQLGITPVEYTVTSERRFPGRGCPVQKLLGFFLKAE